MTNELRARSRSSHPAFDGTVDQPAYDLQWPWNILPAILIGMSFVMLVIIIVNMERNPVNPWKGSAFALLLMYVDQNMRSGAAGQLDIHKDIEKAVGKKGVILESDHAGDWRITQM